MKNQTAVSALQSRIAKRQNLLRMLNLDREQTRSELKTTGAEPGFYKSFLLNHYRHVRHYINDLVEDQVLDKTLQRGMTLLRRTRSRQVDEDVTKAVVFTSGTFVDQDGMVRLASDHFPVFIAH